MSAAPTAMMDVLKERTATQERTMIVAICIFLCVAALVMSLMGQSKTSR